MNTFRNYADYEIPLLQVLNDLPGGQGTSREVKDRFGERFDDRIPDDHRVYLENAREAKWRNIVAWVRSGLVERGLMDAPRYGVWRITDAGRAYLVQVHASTQPVVAPMHTAQPPEDTDENAAFLVGEADLLELAEAEFMQAVRVELESLMSKLETLTPSCSVPHDGVLQVRFSALTGLWYQLHLLVSSAEFELHFEGPSELNAACTKAFMSHKGELSRALKKQVTVEEQTSEYTRVFWKMAAREPLWAVTARIRALDLYLFILRTLPILRAVLDQKDDINVKARVDELTKAAFIEQVRSALEGQLVMTKLTATLKTPLDQLVQVHLPAFSGCHYEIWVHAHTIEVGLHFETSRRLNHARLERFLPHQQALSKALNEQVRAEKWGENAARVVYELPRPILSAAVATELAGRLIALIQATLPILREAFAGKAERPQVEARSESPTRAHAIIDAQVTAIRDFLNGRAGRPSDERLCDWVHLCYEFELYREGRDLFALIDPTQVNPWYYDRAKRSAKVCAMKVAGNA